MGRVAPVERKRPTARLPRLPHPRQFRLVLVPALTLAALAAALAPDDWLRAVAAAVLFGAAYAAGWRDGRRDLAVDIFGRGTGNRNRAANVPGGSEPGGGPGG